jgi:hypothetical protein
MPWPIRLYPTRELARARNGVVPVGAMWWLDPKTTVDQWCEWYAPAVAHRYLREHRRVRRPLFVKLPDGSEFCLDLCSSPEIAAGGGEGWSVSGEPPKVTVTPSINIVGRYHGWITDGVITDDVDGRTFPAVVAPRAGTRRGSG